MSYDPEEEFEPENQTSEDGENRVGGVTEICSDNLENRTEILDGAQHVGNFDQTVCEESSSTGALVDTNLESTTQEFEENERRLDLESERNSQDEVEAAGDESDEAAWAAEETAQSNEVTFIVEQLLPDLII